jgi:hypothetical protein
MFLVHTGVSTPLAHATYHVDDFGNLRRVSCPELMDLWAELADLRSRVSKGTLFHICREQGE